MELTRPELVHTLFFAAPRALVFACFTDPARFARWWGPHGMANHSCVVEAKKGGALALTMRTPEGVDLPVKGTFLEVEAPAKLDFTLSGQGQKDRLELTVTARFEEEKGRTRLTLVTRHGSQTDRDAAVKLGTNEGLAQSFERLEVLLATTPGEADRELKLTRLLDAPRERVWEVFTQPEHLVSWWGPSGFTTTIGAMEVKVGGRWRFVMHGPDGTNYPNLVTYLDVARPERLVYRHGSQDKADDEQFYVTITLEAVGEKTRLTLRQLHKSAAQATEVRKYAVEGGNQTLDRLTAYLAGR